MLELLKTRRSIRKYQDRPVEQEKVDAILKSGLLAPSSRARRPWEFIVVDNKELLKKLALHRGKASFIADAPLAIVVAADAETDDMWIEDASIAAILMQVTAHSLGLGSAWNQVRGRERSEQETAEEYIRKALNIPEKYGILCMLGIGYPDEVKEPYKEEELLYNKIHSNEF
jgi:nitroreductase